MNKGLQKTEVPEWMTKGKTTFIQKDTLKEPAVYNNKPIRSQPMWKKLTAQIRKEIYYS